MGLQGILSRPVLLALALAEHRTRKLNHGPNISAFFSGRLSKWMETKFQTMTKWQERRLCKHSSEFSLVLDSWVLAIEIQGLEWFSEAESIRLKLEWFFQVKLVLNISEVFSNLQEGYYDRKNTSTCNWNNLFTTRAPQKQTYIVLKYSIISHQNTKQLFLYSIFKTMPTLKLYCLTQRNHAPLTPY